MNASPKDAGTDRNTDALPKSGPTRKRVAAALAWLARSQDACGGQGSAAYYSPWAGWGPPYPETSGYLVPTLFRASEYLQEPGYAKRAQRMADAGIDTRPILASRRLQVDRREPLGRIRGRLVLTGIDLLCDILRSLADQPRLANPHDQGRQLRDGPPVTEHGAGLARCRHHACV